MAVQRGAAALVTSPDSTVTLALPHQVRRRFSGLFTDLYILPGSGDAISCCHSSYHASLRSLSRHPYIVVEVRGDDKVVVLQFLDGCPTRSDLVRNICCYSSSITLFPGLGVYPHIYFALRGWHITSKFQIWMILLYIVLPLKVD